jgi:hypothetical protein
MKRAVGILFLLCATSIPVLPSAASDAPSRARSASLPASCIVDTGYVASRVAASSKTTQDVVALLPQPAGGVLRAEPAAKLAATADNPIDAAIFGALAARGIQPAASATDEEFCRRVYLDLTGTQPPAERLLAYVHSTSPTKKETLVDELIGSPAFVDRWTNWLGDLVRNFDAGADFLFNRNAEYGYLRRLVSENRPFDEIASTYLSYTGSYDRGPSGYLPRAAYQVELNQDRLDEVAAESMRAFMGTQIACISCHDGAGHLEGINLFLSGRKRKEFWQIAAFFAQAEFVRIEDPVSDRHNIARNTLGRYDANTANGQGMRPARKGGVIAPSFKLYAKGKPKGGEDPRVALARFVTASPQFARAFVNRLFAHFFVVGIVEPLDGFDLARQDPAAQLPVGWEVQPSNPKLLTDLATSFQQSGFDVRGLMRLVVTSRAYGLSSRYDEAAWSESYTRLYARKLARRLEAEEIFDGVAMATGVPGRHYARGFSTPFGSTMALPGPHEPRPTSFGSPSDEPYGVEGFLQGFGRGDRWVTERSGRTTITQALHLFNNYAITSRVYGAPGALSARVADDLTRRRITSEEAVARVYLGTIGRRPSTAETVALAGRLSDRESVADLQWALINRVDFLYNY